MRIVKRQELMTLPAGTLFAELRQPWVFGELQLKGSTIQWDGANRDFWVLQLAWIEEDCVDLQFEAMLADSSVSTPAETVWGRYGLYDDDQAFLVYEPADTRRLIFAINGTGQ